MWRTGGGAETSGSSPRRWKSLWTTLLLEKRPISTANQPELSFPEPFQHCGIRPGPAGAPGHRSLRRKIGGHPARLRRHRRGPTTPQEPHTSGPSSPPSLPSASEAYVAGYWHLPSPKEAYPGTEAAKKTLSAGLVTPKAEKKDKAEKKSEKIKEQQKGKLAKVEQRVKSKDKLKSDKYQECGRLVLGRSVVDPHLVDTDLDL